MAKGGTGNVVPSIVAAEHIGEDTGDNIEAKRVAPYSWNGSEWQRSPTPFVDTAYDYSGFSNPDGGGNYQTIEFKTGGPSGSVVRTLSLTYDGNNNVTSITRT